MSTRNNWRRVSRDRRCPICDHADWCLVSSDCNAVICPRVKSPKRCGDAGWLHRLRDSDWQPPHRFVRHIRLEPVASVRSDLAQLAEEYRHAIDSGRLHQLADTIGVSVGSLLSLQIGWANEYRAYSFPMRDSSGDVLGIRLRRSDGSKFAVKSGREGLFLPEDADASESPLLICEGPTDVTALMDMGFAHAVGRPSCTGGIKLVTELCQRRHPPEVVIVSDGDEPGRRGADILASVLVAYVPTVRVIVLPDGIKDARCWLRAGGTRRDVEKHIADAAVRRLVIKAQGQKGSKQHG